MSDSPHLIIPQLAGFYSAAAPLAEALLRVVVGLSLVPHGLRMSMGFFPNSGGPVGNVRDFAALLDNGGYRPGRLWAWVIVVTELVGGPLLALGLFTRAVAIPIVILLVRLRPPVSAVFVVACVPIGYQMAQLFFNATLI